MDAQLETGDARRRLRSRRPGNSQTHDVLAQFSHELRNYLGVIRSAMHILKVNPVENRAHEEARVLIERQIDSMVNLTDDLLDVARMRHGRLQLRRTRIDMCMVVARAMHAVEGVMRLREQHMTVSYPDTPVWLHGDARRLEQVLVNLLLNSAKYTSVGGDVSLSVTQKGDVAIVAIRDTGLGIAADVLPGVFDLYVQANPSSRDGGLGLGLPLVRALVEGHGGSVTASSDGIGCGSEFTIRLPAFARP